MVRKLSIRVVALDGWPAADRHAWSCARAGGSVLDDHGALSHVAEVRLPHLLRAYGSWLGYLADHEGLKSLESGLDHLTRECLGGFLRLLEAHLAPCTARNYLTGLRAVARGLRPDADLPELDAATRRAWRDARPVRDKRSRIVPSRELWTLGIDLMDTCGECSTRPKTMGQFRDGLTIALLASRPIRLGNLARIEIGLHLRRLGDTFWLFFDADEMKNRRSLEFPLPRQLTGPLQHYIEEVRPGFIRQHGRWKTDVGNRLWVGEGGSALETRRIAARICRRTEERFGRSIPPHLFRDAAATSIAEQDAAHVQMIRAILGHASLATAESHYNHAGSLEAARRLQHAVADLRAAS